MKPELYLIILWSEALHQKSRILQDIESKFELIDMYQVEWEKSLFFENLFILYNGDLPLYSEKDKYSGNKPFLCLIIKDCIPKYITIKTKLGNKHIVNKKLYDSKLLYRKWTGGGHKIHCSDNRDETNYQLNVLLKKPYNFYTHYKYNGIVKTIKNNLIFNIY